VRRLPQRNVLSRDDDLRGRPGNHTLASVPCQTLTRMETGTGLLTPSHEASPKILGPDGLPLGQDLQLTLGVARGVALGE
jgi:hypothetical protein